MVMYKNKNKINVQRDVVVPDLLRSLAHANSSDFVSFFFPPPLPLRSLIIRVCRTLSHSQCNNVLITLILVWYRSVIAILQKKITVKRYYIFLCLSNWINEYKFKSINKNLTVDSVVKSNCCFTFFVSHAQYKFLPINETSQSTTAITKCCFNWTTLKISYSSNKKEKKKQNVRNMEEYIQNKYSSYKRISI